MNFCLNEKQKKSQFCMTSRKRSIDIIFCVVGLMIIFCNNLFQGPYFPPPYEPLPDNVKFYYEGEFLFSVLKNVTF